jgi:hypothetical protein
MFMSGMVKLLSGDPAWADLRALQYHFETQPLPTPLAWYAHHLSAAVLRFSTAMVFFIELVLPFLVFLPRRPRAIAAYGFMLLQVLILLTGNYNFFNLLTLSLCLFLFDDRSLDLRLPRAISNRFALKPGGTAGRRAALALALVIVPAALVLEGSRLAQCPIPGILGPVVSQLEQWHVINGYGLFAVMTTRRAEIVIEGSQDRLHWQAYEFKYKPGDLARAPSLNIPHQPRLDWQMWFAALDDPRRLPWFYVFLQRLLEDSPPVTRLLKSTPFQGTPPRYVRAELYDYHFSSAAERAKTGQWWTREYLRPYFPPVSLTPHEP